LKNENLPCPFNVPLKSGRQINHSGSHAQAHSRSRDIAGTPIPTQLMNLAL
jgi:hypothetical protein